MTLSACTIANEFFDIAEKEGEYLTNMQLQKLVFISHGYTLAILFRPLYCDDTYAWQWGPVVREVYEELQKYGRNFVTERLQTKDKLTPDDQELEIINAVWEGYRELTGWQLSALTHKANTPWSRTWETDQFGIIPEAWIAEYYKKIVGSS